MYSSLTTVALAASGLFAFATTVNAEILTVCANDCQYTSINAAINDAQNGDVIQLSAETYFEGEQIDMLGKEITLRGVLDKSGEPASVLDGAGTHRVLACRNREVLENLVIQNGYGELELVGIGTVRVGGGMFGLGGAPHLKNCLFTNNSADHGGGMFLENNCVSTLSDCIFTGNSAGGSGGGISHENSSWSYLTDCTFKGNSAGDHGGGINFGMGSTSPELHDCTFTCNSAGLSGGAIHHAILAQSLLYDCIACQNTADGVSTDDNQISGTFQNLSPENCFRADCNDCSPEECIAPECSDCDTDTCPADLNQDDVVDGADLAYVLGYWGTTDERGDVNKDGMVDAADIGILVSAWGLCPTP